MTACLELLIPPHRVRRLAALEWRLPTAGVLACEQAEDAAPLKLLAADLSARGRRWRVVCGSHGDVVIRRDASIAGDEAYRLTVRAGGAEILASSPAGAYYGLQTLRDLLATAAAEAGAACGRIPVCRIDDAPAFTRRGVYLDCSRGKVPKLATLKMLVEQFARWKINELQLYVENVFRFRKHPNIGWGYSPFSAGELLELQDHCRRHHIRLVGSLASLGHMEKILALPEYTHLGEMPGFRNWPGGTTLCPGDPGSLRLVRDLYEEFVPLFDAIDFNVCGDEPWELGKGRSSKRAAKVGVGRVYLDWLLKLHRLCERLGKRMNVWSDIVLEHPELLKELPADVVLLNWEYAPHGRRIPRTREIAQAGRALMVCPGTNAWNSHGCRLAAGMTNIADFAAVGLRCGAEGLLNTDWGDNGHRNMLAVSMHNFAWGAAQSWNPRGSQSAGFTERFCATVFGERAAIKLAHCIRTLGSAHENLHLPYANTTLLYPLLTEPAESLLASDSRLGQSLASLADGVLESHREAMASLRWPAGEDSESAVSMREFTLASRMDQAACLRGELIRACRAGMPANARVAKRFAEVTSLLAEELHDVWLVRNRPSRLRDQTRLIRRVAVETERQGR